MKQFIAKFFPMLPASYEHQQKLNSYDPAMTQLSRMCLSATCSQYFGNDMRRLRGLITAYGEDGAADYLWSHYAYAMSHFMQYKVIGKDYNRKYSFFQNVLSSVRSVHNYVDSRYKRRYGIGLSSLNDMVGHDDGNAELMSLLTYKDRQLPVSYGSKRKKDDEEMTRLEDLEILGLCDTYNG